MPPPALRIRCLLALGPALVVGCSDTTSTLRLRGSGGSAAVGGAGTVGGASPLGGFGGALSSGGSVGGATSSAGSSNARGGAAGAGGNTSATGGARASSGGTSSDAGAAANADGNPSTSGAGTGGATSDAGAFTTRPIAAPPTYSGTVNDAVGCSQDYATRGFEPDDSTAGRHPLFLYFTGTNFVSDAASFRGQSAPAVNAVTEAMARRGFVALWVEYDNGAIAWLSDHAAQLDCLFGTAQTSALAVACAMPEVDCGLGIAVWGHSQGAFVANRAYGFDPRVRAAWLTGYGGDSMATMPTNRLRIVNGEADTTNGQVATVNQVSGLTTADCPDDGRSQCFRADGSGWVIVRAKDCLNATADHCWFDHKTCTDSQVTLEPNWVDPASTKPFALESNADWIARTALTP